MSSDKTGIVMLQMPQALVQSRPRTISTERRSQVILKSSTQVKAPVGVVTVTDEETVWDRASWAEFSRRAKLVDMQDGKAWGEYTTEAGTPPTTKDMMYKVWGRREEWKTVWNMMRVHKWRRAPVPSAVGCVLNTVFKVRSGWPRESQTSANFQKSESIREVEIPASNSGSNCCRPTTAFNQVFNSLSDFFHYLTVTSKIRNICLK